MAFSQPERNMAETLPISIRSGVGDIESSYYLLQYTERAEARFKCDMFGIDRLGENPSRRTCPAPGIQGKPLPPGARCAIGISGGRGLRVFRLRELRSSSVGPRAQGNTPLSCLPPAVWRRDQSCKSRADIMVATLCPYTLASTKYRYVKRTGVQRFCCATLGSDECSYLFRS